MSEASSKIWIRLMAVLQLMNSLLFLQSGFIAYQQLSQLSAATGAINLSICAVLCMVNLVAGWTLLDETKFGMRLSFINILFQVVSVNLPFLAYVYTGAARFSLLFTVQGVPNPDLRIGFSFDVLSANFRIALSQLPNFPTVAISPIALAFVIYMARRLRSGPTSQLLAPAVDNI
jgi:hypothetical protein